MLRRTKKICLTLAAGSSILLAGCPSAPQPPRAVEVSAHEAAPTLTAIMAGNLVGIGGLGPLPTLTASGAALIPEGPEEAPAGRVESATPMRRPIYHASYAHPTYRYGSGFHAPAPIILTPISSSRPATTARSSTTSRPSVSSSSHAGGFGSTGHSASS